jgi:hypothetical protein
MGATHFLMKTLPRVAGEMALHVLAYNLTRQNGGPSRLAVIIRRALLCTLPPNRFYTTKTQVGRSANRVQTAEPGRKLPVRFRSRTRQSGRFCRVGAAAGLDPLRLFVAERCMTHSVGRVRGRTQWAP